MKRWALIIAMGIIAIIAIWQISKIFTSHSSEANKPKKPNPLVSIKTVELGEISQNLDLTGSVEATRVARLASPAEGPIYNCLVREGDIVKEGARILSIGRKKAAEALLLSAQQDVRTEKEEMESIEKLVQSGAIPQDQLQLAKAKYARMVAQLERVKENSEDYEVVAPWDGIVSKVLVNDGNYVSARAALAEVFDPKSLVIRMAVPEAQSQEIAPNMEVTVKLDAYKGRTFQGKVARIYPDLDRRMRTRTVEVEITDDVTLVPGMFARLSLALKSEKDTAVVPLEAVLATTEGTRIAYVVKDGIASKRMIKVGIEGQDKIQILSGVTPGEQIVVAGNEKLKDGIEIRVSGDKKPEPGDSKPKGEKEKRGADK